MIEISIILYCRHPTTVVAPGPIYYEDVLSSKRNMDLVQKCTKLADAIPMLEVRVKVAFKI